MDLQPVIKSVAEIGDLVRASRGEVKDLADRIGKLEAKGARGSAPADRADRPFDALRNAEELAALRSGKSSLARLELKLAIAGPEFVRKTAVVSTVNAGSPAAGYPVAEGRVEGVFGQIRRPLALLDLLVSQPVPGNVVEFVTEEHVENDAAVQAAEGEAKAEANFSFELHQQTVLTYAVYATGSRQVLADVGTLQAYIEQKLAYNVRELIEQDIVTGTPGGSSTTGLLEAATAYAASATKNADKIGEAIAYQQGRGIAADLVILNPVAWFAIASERASGSGEYVNGAGWMTPNNGPLWGAPVVTTTSLDASTALVISRSDCRYWDRQQVGVEIGLINDQFTRNMVTLLCEARGAFSVLNDAAVLKVTLT